MMEYKPHAPHEYHKKKFKKIKMKTKVNGLWKCVKFINKDSKW